MTTSQALVGAAEVHVGWREQRYAAVVMVLVVPVKIRRAEGAPVSVTAEFPRKCRVVVERLERALRERVVVRRMRPVVAFGGVKLGQELDEQLGCASEQHGRRGARAAPGARGTSCSTSRTDCLSAADISLADVDRGCVHFFGLRPQRNVATESPSAFRIATAPVAGMTSPTSLTRRPRRSRASSGRSQERCNFF